MLANMLKLVIWDLDGTLVDSLGVTFDAFNDALEPFLGRRMPIPELTTHFGLAEIEILNRILGPDKGPAAYEIFRESTVRRSKEIQVFDGVTEVLEQVRSLGLKQAIFTGRGRQGTEFTLTELGLWKYFDTVVTNTDVPEPKPSPEGIHKICEELAVPVLVHVEIQLGLGHGDDADSGFVTRPLENAEQLHLEVRNCFRKALKPPPPL